MQFHCLCIYYRLCKNQDIRFLRFPISIIQGVTIPFRKKGKSNNPFCNAIKITCIMGFCKLSKHAYKRGYKAHASLSMIFSFMIISLHVVNPMCSTMDDSL